MRRLLQDLAFLVAMVGVLVSLAGCPLPPPAGATRNFDGIRFQWCPPGTFAMGSPSTEAGRNSDEILHEVTLTRGFWLSTFEITQAQWEAVMGNNPSQHVGGDHPVERVSWNDVQEFLIILNATTTGATYRLPTEAEWEYACRAGTTTRFYWGADPDETEIDDNAWYEDNSNGESQPVGEKEPNPFGLHDMSGNVQEWCQDVRGAYPTGAVVDPTGPSMGTRKVIRGGAWSDNPGFCRSANRASSDMDLRIDNIGFRLLRTED
jgi:formylglycine-generating enzyme required for sulfatase activity